jgi:CheY-like chemotaxis protein
MDDNAVSRLYQVLLVEDNRINQLVAVSTLEKLG